MGLRGLFYIQIETISQYKQFAGPQKQEVINGHSSTIVCQKLKYLSDVFSGKPMEIFWYGIKKLYDII